MLERTETRSRGTYIFLNIKYTLQIKIYFSIIFFLQLAEFARSWVDIINCIIFEFAIGNFSNACIDRHYTTKKFICLWSGQNTCDTKYQKNWSLLFTTIFRASLLYLLSKCFFFVCSVLKAWLWNINYRYKTVWQIS